MLSVNIGDTAIITVKTLIIVVLFIRLASLKQLICEKNLFLKIGDIYKKIIALIFQSFKESLFTFFV